ncbi:type II toxin-antitoxin system Phd/YefM family antitoxin [Mesorhizobium sp. BAC0120]|uniref:type II toxin-antitoxin system Phd/YefM family antitoxin n=1 Tax=Mesorhizobium sp. BAC0120 TaxID=3090670 RepID=UPI00298C3420|nr:type II toxin-antitoxin system Phd/YefM family antitoxin [Mesorhizobium sp. BAC0120]MDW6024718.1 type II toxin-antitoxin system Phd/YefM family antitoxin [Mesorhizobium sp. BAC0120]
MGKVWTLEDAKNKFSAVVEAAQRGEPQRITKRGVDAVVVLSAQDYKRLSKLDARSKNTFVEHLLDFPKLREGMEDIFDFDERPQIGIRDIVFDK